MPTVLQIENKHFLIPEKKDPCELWVSYFNSLKKQVGTSNARTLWLITWKYNGNTQCSTNPNFNKWLQSNQIDVSTIASRTLADFSAIGSNILGFGKNISTVLQWGIPLTLAGLLIGIIVVLWRTSKTMEVSDLTMLTPTGRAMKGLKLAGK
ncbi:hypothetical protein HN014_10735 [Aquimarina sp. TRL1]|uniref:hypothetical protein n=1 Tax=Aquimarina sp. (strain TRL1) TaxID=2736252 RepID=UPI0015889C4D|nr:hypothetical protein [Aquimarina sp. TRL1]QKX05370.1 hypothetical protein HN014_10735 [Aquimarina sp. TRL1]